MRISILLAALAVTITTSALGEEARLNVPIMITGDIGKDACPRRGRVTGIADRPEGMLAVQSGPGENGPFREIDRLQDAAVVLVCERLAGWSGIVYGTDSLGCRTYVVLPVTQEYTGPCHRGWVMSRFISVGDE